MSRGLAKVYGEFDKIKEFPGIMMESCEQKILRGLGSESCTRGVEGSRADRKACEICEQRQNLLGGQRRIHAEER